MMLLSTRLRRLGIGRSEALAAYAVLVTASAVTTAAVFAFAGGQISDPAVVAALAGASAVGERAQVRLGSKVRVSVALLPALFAAVVFGALAAMIVYAASMLLKWD